MFDIGAQELLLTAVVAIVVIGPKDLPRALRVAGGWIAKIRRVSGHFRSGIEEMIRQAELEEMEKKWREKNEAIMQQEAAAEPPSATAEAAPLDHHAPVPPAHDPLPASVTETPPRPAEPAADHTAPELPLGGPKAHP